MKIIISTDEKHFEQRLESEINDEMGKKEKKNLFSFTFVKNKKRGTNGKTNGSSDF